MAAACLETSESQSRQRCPKSEDTLACCICLDSIKSFSETSCMSCVCEGIFHKECLGLVSVTSLHPMRGELRQCPYCRTLGTVVELREELAMICPPANKRAAVEKRISFLGRYFASSAKAMKEREAEILKKVTYLGDVMNRLRSDGSDGEKWYSSLVHPCGGIRRRKRGIVGGEGTFCQICEEGILDFSELSSQACRCRALYHQACLTAASSKQPPPQDRIPCCPVCLGLSIIPEGISLKEVARNSFRGSPLKNSLADMKKEVKVLEADQVRFARELDVSIRRACSAYKQKKQEEAQQKERLAQNAPKRRRIYLPV